MYPTEGLLHGEIFVLSTLVAVGMWVIASVIAVAVAYVATREPTPVRATAIANTKTQPAWGTASAATPAVG
jgi:ABC-type spermidine/putrescine transport system permease subunit I